MGSSESFKQETNEISWLFKQKKYQMVVEAFFNQYISKTKSSSIPREDISFVTYSLLKLVSKQYIRLRKESSDDKKGRKYFGIRIPPRHIQF